MRNPEETTADSTPGGKPKQSIGKIILVLIIFGVAVIACTALSTLYIVPWGQSLFISSDPAESTPIPLSPTAAPPQEPAAEPTNEPATSACKQTGSVSYLVLGVDAPYSNEPKGADAIRLVHLDFDAQQITVVALPRDLWVDTPALSSLGIASERLGITYYHAKQNTPAGNDEVVYSTNVLAQTLYDNFGFIPDHYVTMQISQFDDVIDSIGGVLINVPEGYSSVNYFYPAGEVRVNGDQALEYISTLLVGTEWDRLERQDILLQALEEKLLSPAIIGSLPALISELNETVTTDLSVLEMTDLSCLGNDLSSGKITYVNVDETMVTRHPGSDILIPDRDAIREMLDEIFK
jgi:LCP family protein required for cell wall assembly